MKSRAMHHLGMAWASATEIQTVEELHVVLLVRGTYIPWSEIQVRWAAGLL